MARRLGPPPWRESVTARLDAQTVGSWMDRHVRTSAGRLVITVAVAASFCCRREELSLLAFAAHVGGAGGLSSLIAVTGGALAYRMAEGAAALPARLADALAPGVRLESPVARIERGAGDARLVDAFLAAARHGDFGALLAVLDLHVALRPGEAVAVTPRAAGHCHCQ